MKGCTSAVFFAFTPAKILTNLLTKHDINQFSL
jgi:hypothetical protein